MKPHLWERPELRAEIGRIFNECVSADENGLISITLQAIERELEKGAAPRFTTYFQTVQTTFGPAERDEHGYGYDRRFRSIGCGAVTEDGTVWLYSYDYATCVNGGDAITRWVRADGKIVEPIPGQPS